MGTDRSKILSLRILEQQPFLLIGFWIDYLYTLSRFINTITRSSQANGFCRALNFNGGSVSVWDLGVVVVIISYIEIFKQQQRISPKQVGEKWKEDLKVHNILELMLKERAEALKEVHPTSY